MSAEENYADYLWHMSLDHASDWIEDDSRCTGYARYSDQIRCKYCGRRGFTWDKEDGRWRLLTPTGKVHSCKARQHGGKVSLALLPDANPS